MNTKRNGLSIHGFIDVMRPYGLTALNLAHRAHVSYSSIVKYNRGDVTMPKDVLEVLTEVLQEEIAKMQLYVEYLKAMKERKEYDR